MRLSNLDRRLAKVERLVADRARREKLANCNCCPHDPERIGNIFLVSDARRFEAEMNLTCPAHGFRCLGEIMVLLRQKAGGTIAEESVRLTEVVDEYKRRLSEFLKSHPELKDDRDEF